MMILKGIIAVMIIGICAYLGTVKAKSFENRLMELKKIQSALNMFRSKIEFTYEPIQDIFEEISQVVYQKKSNIFQNTIHYLLTQDISDAWYQSIKMTKNDLDIEDRETLKMMGKLLGKTDKMGQISEINLTTTLLERQIEKAEIARNKNVKLYKTLGTVFGLGIVIMFI